MTSRRNISAPLIRRRMISRGSGYLYGTAIVAGNPDTPARKWVHLYVEIDHIPGNFRRGLTQWLAAMRSDNGDWRFDHLDMSSRYTVIAFDHVGVHDPIIKAGLLPSPMEA